jgi:hypothetical protein
MHQCIKFILEWRSICFGRSFRPSSDVQDCTYSNRHLSDRCILTYVQSWTPDYGRKDRPKHVERHSKTKSILYVGTSSWFYYRKSSCLSVCIYKLVSHWADSCENWYLRIIRRSLCRIQVSLKSDRNNGNLRWAQHTIMIVSLWMIIGRGHENVLYLQYFLKYIRAFYAIMWQEHKIHYYFSTAIIFARTCHIVTYVMYVAHIVLSVSLWNLRLKKNFLLSPCCCYFALHVNISSREDFYCLRFFQDRILAKCR